MLPQKLIDNLSKHIQLTEDEIRHCEPFFLAQTVKRNTILLKEGQIAHDALFVLDGCLRSYSVDHNGFEHILQFAPEDWWITDMYSFIAQKPGSLYIHALMDSDILILSRKNQIQLFNDVPKLERYFRIITEKALVSGRQRLIDNLSLTAIERYSTFCETYPGLIHTLPQKMIAAYIGITPEFLSKIRTQLLKKS